MRGDIMKRIQFNCYNCMEFGFEKVKYYNGDIVEMSEEKADYFISRGVATLYTETEKKMKKRYRSRKEKKKYRSRKE